MKLAGFLMLIAGLAIAYTAVLLLRAAAPEAVFVLAGLGVQVIGLALVFRSHALVVGRRE